MAGLFLTMAALAFQSGSPERPLHMQMDRSFTAQQVYTHCLSDHAVRIGAHTSTDARRVVRMAQLYCRNEARALDDVFRAMQRAEGRPRRGAGSVLLRQIAQEAADRLTFARSGRPPIPSNACAGAFPGRLPPSPSRWLPR